MKRMQLYAAGVVVALVPAVAGLVGNGSFSQSLPVRAPDPVAATTGPPASRVSGEDESRAHGRDKVEDNDAARHGPGAAERRIHAAERPDHDVAERHSGHHEAGHHATGHHATGHHASGHHDIGHLHAGHHRTREHTREHHHGHHSGGDAGSHHRGSNGGSDGGGPGGHGSDH